MNRYEQKQKARKERLEARAERLAREAQARYKTAHTMAEAIPFGQPILVGHHSEKRDRNYRERIRGNFEKAFELDKQAKEVDGRVASVGTGGISSDDPDAVTKLREKLAELKAEQVRMVAANKLVRKGDVEALAKMFGPKIAEQLMQPDFCGRKGFPAYATSNNSANIRRIEERIAHLERAAQRTTKVTELEGDIKVVENAEENRLQIFFPGKPDDATRTELKQRGFRWAPSEGAWQRQLSNGAIWAASCVLRNQAEPFDPKQPYGSKTIK